MIRRRMARKSQFKGSFGRALGLSQAFAVMCVFYCTVLSSEPACALELNYGGRLAEPSGEPVAGPLDMTFKFYRDASGGNALVTIGVPNVPLVDGMFQVSLNIDPGDLDTLFEGGDKTVYVEVTSQGKIYPRQKFGYVPLALRVPVDGTKIVYDGQGRLTLGPSGGSASRDLPGATGIGGVERVGAESYSTYTLTAAGKDLVGAADLAAQKTLLGVSALEGHVNTKLSLSGGTMTGALDMGGTQKVTNLADPTAAGDAAKKAYVDGKLGGQPLVVGTPSPGQVIKWDGSKFSLAADAVGVAGGGISVLNSLNSGSQSLAVETPGVTSGTRPAWTSDVGTATHILTIPMASASGVSAGLISKSDYDQFGSKQAAITPSSAIDTGSISTHLQSAIELKPYGSIAGTTGELRFRELAANGGNHVGFKAPDALAGDVVWTLPADIGSSGQVLSTGSGGVLSWISMPSVSVVSVAGRTGAVTLSNTDVSGLGSLATASMVSGGTGGTIADNSITNDDISATAAIAQSKVANLTSDLAGKQATIPEGTPTQYYRGDKSWQTLNTSAVAEGSNLYYTSTRAREAFSATAPLVYNTATGTMSLGQASAVGSGYLSASDFTNFSGKQSAISETTILNAGTVTSAQQNGYELKPYGASGGSTGEIRFDELAANGANFVGFKAPDSISVNRIWTLPGQDGAAGQVLTTNGSGSLIWATVSGVGGAGNGTVTSVGITAPTAGISVSGGPISTSGSFSLALSNDLAAVEGLTGTGGIERTDVDTWATYPLTTAGKTLLAGADAAAQRTTLGLGSLATLNSVSGSAVDDGTITNADISASAEIAQSKVANLTSDLAGKQATIPEGTPTQYYRGDKSWQTLNTSAVTEGGSNLYYTDTRAREAFSATAPLVYDAVTGVMSLGQASAVGSGYLSASDFTNFSAKQSAISDTTTLNAGTVISAKQNGYELKPYGSSAGSTGEIRFDELAANGANFVGFKAPDELAGNVVWTLPNVMGTSGQVLSTGAGGMLSWTSLPAVPVTSVAGRTGAVTLSSSDIAGTVALSQGGTGADLSSTGGTGRYLKQSTVGGAVSVGTIDATDIPWGSPGAIGATTANSGAFTILTASGNVGIGTTDPSYKLHVSAGNNSQAFFGPNTSWGGNLLVGASPSGISANTSQVISTNGNLHLDSATGKYVSINFYSQTNTLINAAGGNVGIGTTAPSSILAFGGTAARTIAVERHTAADTAGNALTVRAGGATSAATDKNGGNLVLGSGIATGTGSSAIQFQTATAGTTGTTDNAPSTKMTITGDGNVGIGTTSPTSRLHVTGGNIALTSENGSVSYF